MVSYMAKETFQTRSCHFGQQNPNMQQKKKKRTSSEWQGILKHSIKMLVTDLTPDTNLDARWPVRQGNEMSEAGQ